MTFTIMKYTDLFPISKVMQTLFPIILRCGETECYSSDDINCSTVNFILNLSFYFIYYAGVNNLNAFIEAIKERMALEHLKYQFFRCDHIFCKFIYEFSYILRSCFCRFFFLIISKIGMPVCQT